jgi:hypothetical protein
MKTISVLFLLCAAAFAQAPTGKIAILGGASAGNSLGYQPGPRIAFDLDVGKGRWEFINRFLYDLSRKRGSSSFYTIDNKSIVRYGERFRFGAGLMLGRVTGNFGERSSVSPLLHIAYRQRSGIFPHGDTPTYDRWTVEPYLTARLGEFGNKTHSHSTRGADIGVELSQRWGKNWGTKVDFGVTILSWINQSETSRRSGSSPFGQGGVYYSW